MQDGWWTSTEAVSLPFGPRMLGMLMLVAALSACEHSVVSVVEVADIELSPVEVTLMEGERETLAFVLRATGGAELSERTVTWTVEDEAVASVTSSGVVEGRAPGTTRIHASIDGVSATAEVTVVPGPEVQVSVRTLDLDRSTGNTDGITREVEVENTGNGTLDRLTARVREGNAGWLSARLLGTTAPTRLRLSASAKGLSAGVYEALVRVESPAARNGWIDVTVRLTVVDRPEPKADPEPDPDDSCHIRDRTFGDDVEIRRYSTCTFTNVRVRGDVKLERGSVLIASELRVDGDLEADGADELTLTRSRIGGDLEFEKGGTITLIDSHVGGKVEIKENRGRIDLRDNTVEDDVKLEKNRGGPFTLFRNEIDGKLECKENTPSPTGSGNVVGKKEGGQCRGL